MTVSEAKPPPSLPSRIAVILWAVGGLCCLFLGPLLLLLLSALPYYFPSGGADPPEAVWAAWPAALFT